MHFFQTLFQLNDQIQFGRINRVSDRRPVRRVGPSCPEGAQPTGSLV